MKQIIMVFSPVMQTLTAIGKKKCRCFQSSFCLDKTRKLYNILRLLVAASLLTLQGCGDTEPQEYCWHIGGGIYEERIFAGENFKHGNWHVLIGPKNDKKQWNGEVEVYSEPDGIKTNRYLIEKVNFKDGKRHGKCSYYDRSGKVEQEDWYDNGILTAPPLDVDLSLQTHLLQTDDLDKIIEISHPTIIKHLIHRKPWLIYKLEIFGSPPEFLMNFVAEVEYLLRNTSASQDNFDQSFNFGAWAVGGSDRYSVYKDLYSAYSAIVSLEGRESNKNNPLRLAVLKRHRTGNNSTFTVLQTSFPQYLLALRTLGAKISDVQVYTNRLDTYLNKFNTALNKIPITDPLFAIKVDQRLINALYILDNLYFESGNVTSALSNHATGIYNDANPLLDAARHAYFGNTFPVTVKTSGAGNVTGEGINCGTNDTDCKEYHDVNTTITLTAAPGTGARFTGWSGDCTGTALTCTLKITQARQALATFVGGGSPYNLSIRQIGDGYVKGSPSGIDCWGRCSADYAPGTVVTLTATPDDLSEFAGWGGSCSGTQSTCKLTMNGEKIVSATFRTIKPSFPLAVFRDGPGDVQDDSWSIDCGNDCTWQHPVDTQITLKAVPLSDARFVKWTGACKGTAETCVLTIKGETYVGAAFVSD